MVHQIVAEQSAGISETLWVLARRRIQQDACGLEGLRAQDHCLGTDLPGFFGRAMDEGDALRFVGARVHVDMADDSIRNECAIPSLQRILHCGERTAEIRKRHAAALARTTIMTGCPAIVRLSQDGDAPHGESSSEVLLHAFPQTYLSTTHLHRREKLAVGQHFIFLCRTADADIALNDVVIGREIGVGKWPVRIVAIATGSFEVYIAQPIAMPPPDQRSASQNPKPLPSERLV